MTDRELLELAAKAAGIVHYQSDRPFGSDAPYWNPLTDDGDVARMEAKLGLNILWTDEHVIAYQRGKSGNPEKYSFHDGDKQKARRYASTKVAAEIARSNEQIGKGMKDD